MSSSTEQPYTPSPIDIRYLQRRQYEMSLFNEALNDIENAVCYNSNQDACKAFYEQTKRVFVYKTPHQSSTEIDRSADFVVALKHTHTNPVICSVETDGPMPTVIHQFIANPNTLTWVLNGIPLFLRPLSLNIRIRLTDGFTCETLDIPIELYKGYTTHQLKISFIMNPPLHKLSETDYLVYVDGSITNFSYPTLEFNPDIHFMYKELSKNPFHEVVGPWHQSTITPDFMKQLHINTHSHEVVGPWHQSTITADFMKQAN